MIRSALVVAGLVALSFAPVATQAPSFPEPLNAYLRSGAALSPSELSSLRSGAVVTKLLDSDPAREVAVFGAVWIRASVQKYLDTVADIERFEQGKGFLVTKKISRPPKLADFAAMQFTAEDIDELRKCKVGDCAIKLSAESLKQFQSEVDWTSPAAGEQASELARRMSLGFVTGYLAGGNASLAIYRDQEHPTFVADEFKSLIERMPTLTRALPDLQRYLLEFPRAQLPGAQSFLYWQAVQFGLKATVRINHVVMQPLPGGAVVAVKQLYASHYFWTALELRVLVEDPSRGPGFYLVTVSRSRSDGLSGFVGRLIRSRVRNGAKDGIESALETTKRRLE
ncbi:MAG: hypothetical protein AB7O67_12545 [Vicinamibacterales bacterium]